MDLAASDLAEYLIKILPVRCFSFTTTAEHKDARDAKKKSAYIALGFGT